MIAISAESTIDMPEDLLNKFDIKTIPFTVIMGDKDYLDGKIDCGEIFKFVTMNYLTSKDAPVMAKQKSSKHLLITLLSSGLVWLVATTVFVFLLLFTSLSKTWLCFIYALPVMSIVLIVFSCLWTKNIWQFLASTLLIWTSLVALCLTIPNIWQILLIGAPLQILLILLFFLKVRNIKR